MSRVWTMLFVAAISWSGGATPVASASAPLDKLSEPAPAPTSTPGSVATTAPPTPTSTVENDVFDALAQSGNQASGGQGSNGQGSEDQGTTPAVPAAPANGGGAANSKKPAVEYETHWVTCTSPQMHPSCAGGRAACDAMAGRPSSARIAQIRRRGSDDAWQTVGDPTCDPNATPDLPDGSPAPPPPPIPSVAEIQEAYESLPFAQPETVTQPVGNKTLVNLPTYFQASWPQDGGLRPGQVSEPIKLLSWTIEFRVAVAEYNYDFGDGERSGWVTSEGGPYPDGDIRHTYDQPDKVQVKVDARLRGQMRVNGGEWEDAPGLADLQAEPSSPLTVLEAQPRLVSPGS